MGDGSMGLGGEAGNEAIIPLKRMSTGDLGVRAEMGQGRGGTYNDYRKIDLSIDVHGATDYDSFKRGRRQMAEQFGRVLQTKTGFRG